MKIFSRLVVSNCIIAFIVATLSPFSISKPSGEMQTGDWLLFIWGGFTVIGGLVWWGYLFYHWGTNEFRNRTIKKIWFWVLLLGTLLYFIAPIVYYIAVVEMGKGLKGKTKEAESTITV